MRLNISIQCYGMVLIAAFTLLSRKKETNESIIKYPLKIVEAKGYVGPKNGMAMPRIIPFEDLIVGPVIKHVHVMAIDDIHLIGRPKILQFTV